MYRMLDEGCLFAGQKSRDAGSQQDTGIDRGG